MKSIWLMIAAMAGFALADLSIALASSTLPPGQIIAMMGLGAGLLFCAITKVLGRPVQWAMAINPVVLTRNGAEVLGTFGVVQALALLPLATTSAILQVTPLVVMVGAALVLRETIGWRRWIAVLVGFIGVMIMVRPTEGVTAGAALALLGVFGLAARDVSTRRVPQGISNLDLSVFGFLSLVPMALVMMAFGTPPVVPDLRDWGVMMCVIGFASIAYFCVTAALRVGDVSAVTPFRYTRLVFAMILGIVALGQWPDSATLIGGAIVVGAGLYALMRERQRLSSPTLPG